MSVIPEIPMQIPVSIRRVLIQMREKIAALTPTNQPPATPPSISVTPVPGGVRVEWPLTDADSYDLLVSNGPGWTASSGWLIDAGRSNVYTDVIGVPSITR